MDLIISVELWENLGEALDAFGGLEVGDFMIMVELRLCSSVAGDISTEAEDLGDGPRNRTETGCS